MNTIEVNHISKSFGPQKVLNQVSFDVKPGEIFGLLGPNGAGKTTCIRIVLDIFKPDSGSIKIFNSSMSEEKKNLIGYLPEERGLYPKSNVLNTLLYFAQLKGKSKNDSLEISNYWLERLNLSNYKHFHLEELSKGNQQKVQFIAAIQHNPEILILDEPFSGFDPLNQTIFTEIINELKEEKLIILSTHLMDLAEKLCDDFLLINNGKEVLKGDLEKILNSYEKNIFEIESKNPFNLELLKNYKGIEILHFSENNIKIDLHEISSDDFLKFIISHNSVASFRKVIPSLHELFISQVEGK